MIELSVTGQCDNCPLANIKIDYEPIVKNERIVGRTWYAVCENKDVCEHFDRYMQKLTNNSNRISDIR